MRRHLSQPGPGAAVTLSLADAYKVEAVVLASSLIFVAVLRLISSCSYCVSRDVFSYNLQDNALLYIRLRKTPLQPYACVIEERPGQASRMPHHYRAAGAKWHTIRGGENSE